MCHRSGGSGLSQSPLVGWPLRFTGLNTKSRENRSFFRGLEQDEIALSSIRVQEMAVLTALLGVKASLHPAALQFYLGLRATQHFHFGGCEEVVDDPAQVTAHGLARLGGISRT